MSDDCVACGAELEDVFGLDNQQYDNALEIKLIGGYGMFFDDIDRGDHHVFLCHDCAHAACEQLPWLDKLINPLNSHSHRQSYWDANPRHEGWDKKEVVV